MFNQVKNQDLFKQINWINKEENPAYANHIEDIKAMLSQWNSQEVLDIFKFTTYKKNLLVSIGDFKKHKEYKTTHNGNAPKLVVGSAVNHKLYTDKELKKEMLAYKIEIVRTVSTDNEEVATWTDLKRNFFYLRCLYVGINENI